MTAGREVHSERDVPCSAENRADRYRGTAEARRRENAAKLTRKAKMTHQQRLGGDSSGWVALRGREPDVTHHKTDGPGIAVWQCGSAAGGLKVDCRRRRHDAEDDAGVGDESRGRRVVGMTCAHSVFGAHETEISAFAGHQRTQIQRQTQTDMANGSGAAGRRGQDACSARAEETAPHVHRALRSRTLQNGRQ